ncbi:MAG: TraR/DksA C4-type zinc finger protein [Ketobacteraceae bacterium]|nr:TraR/DksA C4-type zinc finger protein [Ketobacteraceae bacterium]
MNEDDIVEMKAVIQARIEFLLVMIDENARSASSSGIHPNDMFESAGRADGHPVAEDAIRQAQQELTQLTRNLSWLESDRGGVCELCGRNIPLERLKRVPTTRTCSNCA